MKKPHYPAEMNSQPSGWMGHAPFAYSLVKKLKPSLIVELGVQFGHSLYVMAQSAKDHGIDCSIYGVDSWKGDPHSIHKGDHVFKFAKSVGDKHFKNVYLVPHFFDDALEFVPNDIDLLHIDGNHLYKQVRNDADKWIPKTSDRAVIIMHDTNHPKYGEEFGVKKVFNEIIKEHPEWGYCEFKHANGLGVISKDPKFLEGLINEK